MTTYFMLEFSDGQYVVYKESLARALFGIAQKSQSVSVQFPKPTFDRVITRLVTPFYRNTKIEKELTDAHDILQMGLLDNPIRKLIEKNRIDVLDWAYEHGWYITPRAGEYAGACKDYAVITWLQNHGVPLENVANGAIKAGNVELLIRLHENKYPFEPKAYLIATEANQVGAFVWLHNKANIPLANSEVICATAAGCGALGILQMMLKSGRCLKKPRLYHYAAQKNHTEIMEWLRVNGFPISQPPPVPEVEPWLMELLLEVERNGISPILLAGLGRRHPSKRPYSEIAC